MRTIERLTCDEVLRRLDDYLDRELSAEETRRVREHLESCAVCVGEYRFEAGVLEELRRKLERITAPPDLLGRVTRELTAGLGAR